MSYVSVLIHIVFSTKLRIPTISVAEASKLHAVIAGEINRQKCHAYLVNGVQNHIHILTSLHPTVTLADLVRNVKSSSSYWAQRSGLFPLFKGWESEYGAFSFAYKDLNAMYGYVANQQVHHESVKLEEEYERLVRKAGLVLYPG